MAKGRAAGATLAARSADEMRGRLLLDGNSERLAPPRTGRAIVALDIDKAKENLVLLELPIFAGGAS